MQSYDAIVSNSLLHHLHRPAGFWEMIADTGAPGAPVVVMDLFRPADAATAEELVDTYAAGEPEVLRKDFHASLLAERVVVAVEVAELDGGREVVVDRHPRGGGVGEGVDTGPSVGIASAAATANRVVAPSKAIAGGGAGEGVDAVLAVRPRPRKVAPHPSVWRFASFNAGNLGENDLSTILVSVWRPVGGVCLRWAS